MSVYVDRHGEDVVNHLSGSSQALLFGAECHADSFPETKTTGREHV
jgi:hypothetical protein